ncbi:MAG: hydantoinase/oxoprolinase family protein, partial [Solirubrobacteraceae bacterium]
RRPQIGPDSAGARIGTCWPEGGIDTVTVTDLNLVLGRLNPEYFLGGDIDLDMDRARFEVDRQIAKPLGLSIPDAAAGIVELFETTLRNEAMGRIHGRGYSPIDYTLLCYGGGGPLHVAGYTEGVPYQQVIVPSWAAGFSAFGCACADFEYRFDRTVDLPLLPTMDEPTKLGVGAMLGQAWTALRGRVADEFAKSGVPAQSVRYVHGVRMQYYGQLIDIEVDAPGEQLTTIEDVERLTATFETAYARTYARSAPSPELGYLVTQAIVRGVVDVEKPVLPDMPQQSGAPPTKGSRSVRWRTETAQTDVYEMGDVLAGHTIEGPAVVEAPATTFAIPPGRRAWLDGHGLFHLETT